MVPIWYLAIIIPAVCGFNFFIYALLAYRSEPDECNPIHCKYYSIDKE
jgi:hypothetical protein